MLHLEQIKVLRKLNKARKKEPILTGDILTANKKHIDNDRLAKLCQTLKDDGYLDTFVLNIYGEISVLELSYRGITYAREVRNQIIKTTFNWFSDHMIEILALIISIIALIRS